MFSKESNDIVLKYMKSPRMQRNNDLPVSTVKQAVYLQALCHSSKKVQQKALQVPEIRSAFRQYIDYSDIAQIEAAFPALREMKEEGMSEWCG